MDTRAIFAFVGAFAFCTCPFNLLIVIFFFTNEVSIIPSALWIEFEVEDDGLEWAYVVNTHH